ncbi:putative DNA helicase MCM8 [Blattamonas nauphoetae]|uniref:Minichromosome maintenance 8 n=1 Tax=Blattamonas nauphoetae TaxID=2049346 RepID=A0ABQ9Y771_9EUKA|nr:putative DNA helicase MCM8 [Blattamonas nauphoetae]
MGKQSSPPSGGQPPPFVGWDLYYRGCDPAEYQSTIANVQEWLLFFRSPYAIPISQDDKVKRFIVRFDVTVLKTIPSDSPLLQGKAIREFVTRVEAEPELVFSEIKLAAHHTIFALSKIPDLPYSDQEILLRIMGFRTTPLREVKSNYIDKFVSIKGTIVRVGPIRPLVNECSFECNRCGSKQTMRFPEGRFATPDKCCTSGCRSRAFTPNRQTMKATDWQKIRVQEVISDYRDSGRIPRLMECELADELVGQCVPGDIATVSGIARIISVDEGKSGGNWGQNRGGGGGGGGWRGRGGHQRGGIQVKTKQSTLYSLFIYAHSVSTSRDGFAFDTSYNSTSTHPSSSSSSFSTVKDAALIRKIVLKPNLFPFLVNSIAPHIYGHYTIKQGFLLALFGGTPQYNTGNSGLLPVRSSIHMLVVGDPGMGKSQMLRSVASNTPRGVYVSGNTSTSSGLTVTVVKEGGDFALEAGALILGDRGLCCIDEFDKMGNEHQALLEAMEQQSISIAKGGMVCSLSARTSVIAAANPVGGHYDRSRTVGENLKMSAMILTRFDLVFVLMDTPDAETDKKLSSHLVRIHGKKEEREDARERRRKEEDSNWTESDNLNAQSVEDWESHMPPPSAPVPSTPTHIPPPVLSTPHHTQHNLLQPSTQPSQLHSTSLLDSPTFDPIPSQHLRRYIAYARSFCHPKLSRAARDRLKDYFVQLRKIHNASDSAVVTARQLESLIRLAEARAKCELREEVTENDALDVIDLMKHSLYENLANETGVIDMTRASGMSRSGDISRLTRGIVQLCRNNKTRMLERREIVNVARGIGITKDVDQLIDKLNIHGILLKKPNSMFLVTGAE